jgi:hypothetical protein
MNKLVFFSFFLATTAFFSCKNNQNAPNSTAPNGTTIEHANANNLAGHWIALDFCSRAGSRHSVLKAMNNENAHKPFAYAFSFSADKADSVVCHIGSKSFSLPIRVNIDTIEVKNARNGKSVYLVYIPETKNIELFDNTQDRALIDRLIKSSSTDPNGYTAFTAALNHNLFEGNFTPVGKPSAAPVQFLSSGQINNLGDYDRYSVCTDGGCFVLGDQTDVVLLGDTKTRTTKNFGLRYSTNGDTLSLYNLVQPDPTKAATLGTVAYRFLHTLPVQAPKPAEPKRQQQPAAK